MVLSDRALCEADKILIFKQYGLQIIDMHGIDMRSFSILIVKRGVCAS